MLVLLLSFQPLVPSCCSVSRAPSWARVLVQLLPTSAVTLSPAGFSHLLLPTPCFPRKNLLCCYEGQLRAAVMLEFPSNRAGLCGVYLSSSMVAGGLGVPPHPALNESAEGEPFLSATPGALLIGVSLGA